MSLTSNGRGYRCDDCRAFPVLASHVCGEDAPAPKPNPFTEPASWDRVSIGGVEVPAKIERFPVRGGGDVIGYTRGRCVYVNDATFDADAAKVAETLRSMYEQWEAEHPVD